MIQKYKFCSLLIFFIENAVVFTKERTLQHSPSERQQYAIFEADLFHALDVTRVDVVYVGNDKHCLLKCLKSTKCFSTNVGVHFSKNRQVSCELLSSDKYGSSKHFFANSSFHHYRISSPCESFPCHNGGTCRAIYETEDYNCSCTKHYVGVNCEQLFCGADPTWKGFNTSCYKYFAQVLNFFQAKSHCQTLNSTLVTFGSAEEHAFVIHEILPEAYGRVWIGLTRDPSKKELWRWEDGTHLSFTQWESNEPNNLGRHEDCVQIMFGLQYKTYWYHEWQDINCELLTSDPGFICEKNTNIN